MARREHDLVAMLASVRAGYEFPIDVSIGWATDAKLEGYFDNLPWAAYHPPAKCIVVSSSLKRAPRYVIRYLIVHEVLHSLVKSRGCNDHPRAFRVAEQTYPDYVRANAWLHQFGIRMNEIPLLVPERSHFWREVLAPIYGGSYVAYRLRRSAILRKAAHLV